MDTREIYPEKSGGGAFLKVADFKKKDGTYASGTFVITEAEPNEYEGEQQIALSFQDKEAKLGLNRTNWTIMCQMHGYDNDGWVGKSVRLYIDPNVEYPKGVKIGGIRIQLEVSSEDTDIPF